MHLDACLVRLKARRIAIYTYALITQRILLHVAELAVATGDGKCGHHTVTWFHFLHRAAYILHNPHPLHQSACMYCACQMTFVLLSCLLLGTKATHSILGVASIRALRGPSRAKGKLGTTPHDQRCRPYEKQAAQVQIRCKSEGKDQTAELLSRFTALRKTKQLSSI